MRGPTAKEAKWMQLCEAAASIFSTCSRRQYFAVVLAPNGRVAGVGYNGGPSGITHCVDGGCPRAQSDSVPGSSYSNCIASHAEENALLWSSRSMREGGSIVINGQPCWQCTKLICASGVRTVVYVADNSYVDTAQSMELFERVGIELVKVDR